MNLEIPNEDELAASIFALGLSLGFVRREDVVRWADRRIEEIDQPPLWLIDLSLSQEILLMDVISNLKEAGKGADPKAVFKITFGSLPNVRDLSFDQAESLASRVYYITRNWTGQEIPLIDEASRIDDTFCLARAGILSQQQALQQLTTFFDEHRDEGVARLLQPVMWLPVSVWESGATMSFDEWVARVFAHDAIEPAWWWNENTDWDILQPVLALDYLTRLFEKSGHLLRSYSDAQVNQGLSFLIGTESDHLRCLMDPNVSWSIRLRCIRSILRLFELFASRCSPHLSHLNEPGANPLNSICYMFWDILPLHGQPDSPSFGELDRSLLTVMTEILRLPSDACRESGLHGLGHWQLNYPKVVDESIRSFLAENAAIRPELRRYAENARRGWVL